MLSAFRRADSFRGEAAVTTWLHRIVVNACLDRIRRRGARPTVASGDQAMLDSLADRGARVDPSAAADLAIDIQAALRGLAEDQRLALIYVDMLGYPVADAAMALGVSEGTIKSRCARGRAKLLPMLAHLRPARPADPAGQAVADPAITEGNRSAAGSVLPAVEGGGEAP